MQHLIDINHLSKNNLENILTLAQTYLDKNLQIKRSNKLHNKTICNLFFEPSTRTRVSFEIAAKNLGANVINLDLATSSMTKGESILDTIDTLIAMGIDAFVVRHHQNGIPQFIADHIKNKAHIINAGDGTNQHPTQALLDMLTIKHYKKNFENLTVALVGDLAHSRVANSDVAALKLLGVKKLNLVSCDNNNADNLYDGITDADVIIALRIQKERMAKANIPNFDEYFKKFGLTLENIKCAKNDVIIMHPGPINRNIEIADDLADSPHAVILQQVKMGVAARMAVLAAMLS